VVLPTILPTFRVRQLVTSVNVYDGQTVVLAGLHSEGTQTEKDKVPVLGDPSQASRLPHSESSTNGRRRLLIFITPTIIDPAGNRVHTDEEMPFGQKSIPPQNR
jgi:general secretion pathway protein D